MFVAWDEPSKRILTNTNFFGQVWLRLIPFFTSILARLPDTLKNDTLNLNVIAGSLLLLVSGCLGYLILDWRSAGFWKKASMLVSAAIMTSILVLTLSRGALLALGIAIFFLIGLRLLPRLRKSWGLLLFVCGLVLVLAIVGAPKIQDFISIKGSPGGSYEGRLEIWSRGIFLIQKFPFSGVGLGAFGEAADILTPFQLFKTGTIPHSHNLFLQVAVDLGLPGLLAWVAICWAAIRMAWKLYRTGNPALGGALLCVHVALITHGLWDAVTWGTRPAVILWILWGLTAAAWKVYCPPAATGTVSPHAS
jgi:putative inorganic carbon (HCO3(-)) transporter